MGKKGLEVFKFAVYLTVPVATVLFFNTPEAIKALIERKQYIVYPPEGPRPITGTRDEIGEFLGIKKEEKPAVSADPAAPSKKGWFW